MEDEKERVDEGMGSRAGAKTEHHVNILDQGLYSNNQCKLQ